MVTNRFGATAALALLLLASACVAGASTSRTGERAAGSAFVLTEEQLAGSASTGLVDAIRSRLPSVEVRRDGGRCPRISVRGRRTLTGAGEPLVFIDGTRMADTCAIDQLRASEVRRVEVYPAGATGPSGYGSAPHGMIVIYLVGG